jgi:nucleosome assembly protein 1-like 1
LIFHFSENPFFTNKTLRKTFYFSNDDSQDADWSESDKIEWSEGKNVTVKIVSKK